MRGWEDRRGTAIRDPGIREPGHMPRLLACQCDAGLRVPRLLAIAAVFGQQLAGDDVDALFAAHAPQILYLGRTNLFLVPKASFIELVPARSPLSRGM